MPIDSASVSSTFRLKYEEIFRDEHDKVPHYSYHYTGEQALRGIIGGRCFWCTDLRDVDDKSEGDYAAEIIRDVANRKSVGKDLQRVLNGRPDLLGLKDLYQMYIICFCGAAERPQMWERYGDHGRGYAIKFDSTVLLEGSSDGRSYALVPITYDPSRQAEATECMVDYGIFHWRSLSLPDRDRRVHDREFAGWLLMCGVRFKAPQYAYENEVRLFAFERQDLRRVDSGGRRRVEVPYPQNAIVEVICGPNGSNDTAALCDLLDRPALAHVKIRHSNLTL